MHRPSESQNLMTSRNEFEKWFDNINDTTELPKNISNICNPTNLNYTEMYGPDYTDDELSLDRCSLRCIDNRYEER